MRPSCLLLVLAAGTAANAESDWTQTANAGLASNYVSRGFTQSWSRPALQGGADLSHASGAYLGVWASTLSKKEFKDGPLELDLYGGWTFKLGDAALTAGALYYHYPGSASPGIGGRRYDYAELRLGVAQGPFSANYYTVLTSDWFGTFDNARNSSYLELSATPDLGGGWTLPLQLGVGRIENHPEANWRYLKLGATKAFDGGWSLNLSVHRAWDKNRFYTAADFSRDPQGLNPVKRLGPTQASLLLSKSW